MWLLVSTAAVSCLVAILAWRRRQAPGAKPMAWLMLINAMLAVFYAFAAEALLVNNTTAFLFWDRLVVWFGAIWIFNLFWLTCKLLSPRGKNLTWPLALTVALSLLVAPVAISWDRSWVTVGLNLNSGLTPLGLFLYLPQLFTLALVIYLPIQDRLAMNSSPNKQFWILTPPLWIMILTAVCHGVSIPPTGWTSSFTTLQILNQLTAVWLLVAILRFGLLAHLPYYQSVVFQRMPALGLVLDQQQRILALNPVAEQLFQVQSGQLEGKPLSQVLPVLKDATDTVTIDGQAYSFEIDPLSDRRGQVSGQLIRLSPRPSAVSVQQLSDDLGLELDSLRYQSADGSSYSWNEYLGDLIFKVTIVGHLSDEHMQAEIDIVNLKLAAVLEHYPDRQLHAIIDTRYSYGIDRSSREKTIQQWIEWGEHPCFGRMAIIQSRSFIKVILGTLRRLAPRLKISIHPSEEEALVYLRQQLRQSVDKSEFLQLWQAEQETRQVADQRLKMVRRPEWVCETETARVEYDVIEGETLHVSLFGLISPEVVERSAAMIDQIVAQLGQIKYRIMNGTEVTAAPHTTRVVAAREFNQRQSDFEFSFVIPPKRSRGLAKILYGLLSPATQEKTRQVDNLDQALLQLYGPVVVEQKLVAARMNKSELMEKNSQLQQQVSQYRQRAEVLTRQLGQMLWRSKESVDDDLNWESGSSLGDLAAVVEAVQLDLQELLAEQERRQQEVETTANELTQLIDTANAPIFGVDIDGLINEWNQQVAETTGYSKEEVLGQNLVEDYITQDYKQSVQQVLDQALLGSETDNYQVPLTTKDGREVIILLNATTRRDTQGQVIGVVGVGQDITELNQYRRELEQRVTQRTQELVEARETAEKAQLEAEEANRAKSQFLSRMSHEIRTPMHGVMGSLGLMESDLLTNEQQQQVQQAQTSAEHLLQVINEILEFSRLEAGEVIFHKDPFDLSQTCQQALDLVQPLALQKGLDLRLEWMTNLPSARLGDQQKIRQVLINLLGNAIKFTETGSVRLKALPLEANWLRLEIVDTGTGIAESQQLRLFEAFSQVDESNTRPQGGTGLGLAISQQFVQGMGGQMRVESQPGHGSTFSFELMLPLHEDPLPVSEGLISPAEEIDLQEIRVLVVDDEPVNLAIARGYLQQAGSQVQTAENGQQAVDLFQPGEVDLVLMDLQMPIMDGFQSSQQMRLLEQRLNSEGEPVVIIALSASVVGDVANQCREAGMNDHVGKPFRWTELQAIISRHLRRVNSISEVSDSSKEVSDLSTEEVVSLFQPDQLMELGGLELVQEISVLAGTTIGQSLEELTKAILTEDWSEVRRLSHRIKGAAANSGAQRMSAVVAKISDQAEDQIPGSVTEIHSQLVEIWQQTQTAMQDFVNQQ